MTCARREAGAQQPAASTPPGSPSSRQAPPEGRSRPDPSGGRARLSLLLPVLALLLGALGLFAAAPAQAQTTVWSATLTVEYSTDRNLSAATKYHGCWTPNPSPGSHGLKDCTPAADLTDNTFTHSSTDYTIDGVFLRQSAFNQPVYLHFDLNGLTGAAAKTALTGLTLTVGTGATARSFAFADATAITVHNISMLRWTPSPALSWTDGNTVALKLTAPASTTKPAKPTGLSATAGNAQVALAWTDPSDSSITKYQYRQKAGSAAWGSWTNIPTSAPGETNATSYTVTSLNNGTAYRFRIRAVNSAGNSPQSDIAGPVTPAAPPTDGASFTAAASGWFKSGDTVSLTIRATPNSSALNQQARVEIFRRANADCSGAGTGYGANTNAGTPTTATQQTFNVDVTIGSRPQMVTASTNFCVRISDPSTVFWAQQFPLTNFRVDLTDPGIAFPASPAVPRVGAASTITLSDAHSKIKKYGAIMVDGSTGTAASCDTAAEIGTGNLTTETTPLATKAFSYTVPSGSAGKKVCAYAEDAAGNSNSALWGEAAQAAADNTAPTVTAGSTGYYSDAAATTALTGPQKAGVDIYTKVTFSEDMNHVKSNGAAARPEIFHRIGSTDTRYDILNNADTLASGDCKPEDATSTDVYICRYTVGSSVNGAFRVKVGTNSADKATNTLENAYSHSATLTLDTTAPAAPAGLAATAGDTKVTLTWNDPSPADATIAKWQYRQKTTGNYGTWQDISGASTRSHEVTSLINGTAYTFQVRAVDTASNEGAAGTAGPVTPKASTSTVMPPSNAVWSATLTVSTGSDRYGCGTTAYGSIGNCTSTRLNPNSFTHSGTSYTVEALFVESSVLYFEVDGTATASAFKTALSGLTLTLTESGAASSFAISDSSALSAGPVLTWSEASLNWSVGDTVTVKLTAPATTTKPAKPTGLSATAGNAQVTLSWTDPSDSSITKYQYQQKAGTAAWGSWTNIPTSAPGETNATSYTVTSLINGTAYRFRIRAVNSAGNSPQSNTAGPATPAVPAGPAVTGALAITSGAGTYTTDDDIVVEVTFDKAIVVVGTPKLTIKVGTADRVASCVRKGSTGDDAKKLKCTYTIVDGDNDDDGVSVEANKLSLPTSPTTSIKDSNGNDATLTHNALATQSAHKVDAKAPAITGLAMASTPASGSSYAAAEVIKVEVTFSEEVTVSIGSGESITLALTVGAATKTMSCAHKGSTGEDAKKLVCSYTVASGDADADGVSVAAGSLVLSSGASIEDGQAFEAVVTHTGLATQSGHKVGDTTRPTVSSAGYFSDAAAATALTGPQKAGVDIYTKVTFSEDMNHVKSNGATARPEIFHRIGTTDTQYDILNNADALASGDCKPNHASNTNVYVCRYTVGSSVNGAFRVKVGTSSVDKANNALQTAYTHSASLTLDTTAPAAPAGLAATAGDTKVTLSWNDPSPADATIAKWQYRQKTTGNYGNWQDISGASTRSHEVTSLINGTAYTFQVRAVDTASNEGAAGTAGPATPSSADTTGPAVTGALAITSDAGTYTTDEDIVVEVTFDEAIVVVGTPELTIKVGTADRVASCVRKGSTGDDAKKLKCTYTIVDGDNDDDGVSVEANKLSLPTSPTTTIKDSNGNDATLTHNALATQSAHKVDAKAPAITGLAMASTPASGSSYAASEVIKVEVTFSEEVTVSIGSGESITLALTVGTATKTMSCAHKGSTGEDAKKLVCSYTVASGDADADGVSVAAGSLVLSSGASIEDGQTFEAVVTHTGLATQSAHKVGSAAAPAKPTGLTATAGNAQVALSWTDPSDSSITKYQYRQKAGNAAWGSWTNIPTSAPGETNATSYTVTSLNNGTAYRFRIRAVNSAGNSDPSDIAGPVTPAAPLADGASFTAAASGWFKPGDTVSVTYRITIASGDRNQALRAVIYRSANCSGNNPVAYSNTATNVATLTTAGQHTFTANLTVKSGVATASSNLCAWVGSSARWIARLPLTNFKVDATDPGISFPASPAVPRVGAASTITLSDAHSKIKKYGAIMVDGSTGTAASCDTAAEIGTGNLTTETTALATKAFSYTVPSGSAGKKVCAYAEDAAGNTKSALWGEAAQAAADTTRPTVTAGSTGYYSDAAAATALTGPQKAGVDIYTKVTFSEDMNHVKSNGAAARPEIFHRIGSTDTRYDILNNADTLASGDCKPEDATSTDVYICRYTVAAGVNGAFRVKVGTNSADKANNTLASVYTHTATLTLDTTKPAIAFPSSPAVPRVGVASTITLTDAGAKIKKYKVIEVPGATTAATACDDPSGDSFTPTSLTTAASPKAVSHTPSTGSTGKKLCAYAEDAAGNSNSKLWTTAIQAAPTGPTITGIAITSSPRANTLDQYAIGDVIKVTATFDKVLTLTGTPQLKIKVGTAEKTATCAKKGATGDDAKKLECSYTVAVGDADANGIAVEAGKLSGTIKDGSNNAAVLTYTAISDSSSHKVDGVRPTITGFVIHDGIYTGTNDLRVWVQFSEGVDVTGAPTLSVKVGTQTRTATYSSGGASSDSKPFDYEIQDGDNDADGVSIDAGNLALPGSASIKDYAGNAPATTPMAHPALAAQSGAIVDTTAPGIAFPTAGPRLGSASRIVLTDANAKIKKYGAIVVDGSTGTAANCDTSSEIGTTNLTTLTTPAASVNFDYTPPANSLGKKVCVYAEDAGLNIKSLLWTTAVAAAAVTPPPTLTGSKLVSNTGQTKSVDSDFRDVAQSFATGNRSTRLTGVEIPTQHTSTTAPAYSVAIHADSSDSPGASLGTLANPASLPATANGVARYTAAGSGILLQANTTYFVVVDVTSPGTGTIKRPLTQSNNEDSGAEAGWSIGDGRLHRAHGASTWLTSDHSLKMAVYGRIVTGAPEQLSIPDRPAGPVTLSAANGTSLTLDLETAWRMRGKSVEFRETVLTQAQKTLPAGFWPGGTVMEIDPEVDLQMGENPTVCMPVSSSGETQVLRWDAGRGAWSELTMTSRSASQVCATTVELGLFLAAAGTVTIADKVIRHGYELSDFRAAPEAMRIDVSWSVLNPGTRCRFVVAWREAGTGEWRHEDVFSYHGNVSHGIRGLTEGTSYDVRLFVPAPGSTGDPADADLAYETTVTTKGQSMAPPPIIAAGPALSWARVNAAELALRFDASLDESSVPAGSAFSVSVAGASRAVSAVAVSQETVTLTLASAVTSGEAVTVGYTPPATGKLRASGGGAEVAAFSGQSVTNDTGSRQVQAPPPSPLTASVAGAPSEHRGKGRFAVRVAFSAPVTGDAKAATIQVTGGTLQRAARKGKRKDLWELRIAPSGHGDVTLTLPATADCAATGAICAADGRKLESPFTHTVPGPVTLSVADARAKEGEDATIDFAVTLSRAASGPVTVNYRTRNGTAKAGRDYTKASGTLTFAAGETSKTVAVAVLDDARDEGEETFRLLLGKPKGAVIADGEAVGTIANDDPMPAAWLARFGRTVAGQGVDAVRERMAADRTPGFRGRIAGEALPDGTGTDAMVAERGRDEDEDPLALPELSGSERRAFLALLAPEAAEGLDGGDGGLPDRHALAAKDAMLGTAFEIARETDGGNSLGLWGRVARSGFSGRAGDMALDGEVTTAMIGTDWKRRDTLLGLMLLRSRGEGGHSGPRGEGRMEAELSGLVPWAGLRAGTLSLWGAAGTGRGEMTLAKPDGQDSVTAGLDWSMAAAGAEGALAALGGADLRWRADALAARTDSEAVRSEAGSLAATSSETARLRLGLEAAWARTLASGATLSPRLEIGLRHDGGDAGSGLGVEAGGGVRFTDSGGGLSVSLDGRALALHEDRDLRDWGLAVSVAWDPRPETRLGPSVIASRGWGGAPSGGVAALLEAEALPGGGTDAGSGGLGLEMAWGTDLSAWRHGMVGSAYGRVPDAESLRLGWRVAPDTGLPAGRDHDFWLEPGGEDGAGIGAGLRWSAERRHVRSSTGIDLGARDGGGVEAGFRLTREW